MRRAALAPLAILLSSCHGHDAGTGSRSPSPRELDFTGRPATIALAQARHVTSLKLTRRIPRRVAAGCRRVKLFSCPRHTAAFADTGSGYVVFASVHGHSHLDADIALVADMLRP